MTKKTEIIITAVDKTQPATQSAQRGLAGIGSAAKAAASVLSRFGIAVPLTMGAMAGAAISAANSTAAYAKEMTNLSRVAGTTVEQFSAMSWAAERHGVSAEKLADIYKDVQDKVGDFIQTGGGAMKDFFENIAPRVGVTADEFRRLSGPDALQLYYSSLEKANLSQSDLVFYMEAIASDTTALIPLLQNGGTEFARLADEARNLGVVMDDISAKKAKEFADNMAQIQSVSRGLQIEIGNAVIPTLNRLAQEFLDARAAGLGFGQMLNTIWRTTPLNNGEQIRALTKDIDNLKASMDKPQTARALGMMQEDLDGLSSRREYFKMRQREEALAGAGENYGNEGRVSRAATLSSPPSSGGRTGSKKGRATGAKSATPSDYDAILTERVAAAISATDLVKAQELADTLAKLDQLATAGLDPAIVKAVRDDLNGALGEAAKRYKEMADPLQKYRDQLEEINALHKAGELTLEEAVSAEGEVRREIERTTKAMKDKTVALDDLGSTSQNIDTVITNAFSGAADAIADFAMGGKVSFGDMVSSMIRDLIRLEMQMNMTKAYQSAGGMSGIGKLIGGLFGLGGGSSGIDTSFTSGLGTASNLPSYSAMSFDGGGYTGPGARSGGLDGKGGFWAVMHPDETVIDHTKGRSAPQSIRVEIRNEGTAQEVTGAQPKFDLNGMVIEVFTRDIANEGPMAKSMQSRFGLSRAAGAYA